MEIKDTLKKPYTDKARADFIVKNNYNKGYEIRETDTELQAWGYSNEEIEAQKELKEQQKAYAKTQQAINGLKDDLLTATLADDQEWIADLKAEYSELIEGE